MAKKKKAAKELTFEDVEKHLRKANLGALQSKAKRGVTSKRALAAPADVLSNICEVWGAVRPIVVLISNAIFLPPHWRRALKILIAALDAICPS